MNERVKELVEAAHVLSRAGDREGALRLAEEALRLDPEHAPARDLLVELDSGAAPAVTPFAPPPADLFADVKVRPSANPFARPAAPGSSPPTMPAGVAARPDAPSTLVGGAPATPVAITLVGAQPELPAAKPTPPTDPAGRVVPSKHDPIHPTTLPAGVALRIPLPPSPFTAPPTHARPPTPGMDPLSIIDAPRPPSSPPISQARSRPPPPPPPDDSPEQLLQQARDRVAFADHSGALAVLDKLLAAQPGNAEAQALHNTCESTLVSMYESKLGNLDRRPRLKMRADEVIWLNLDHRAGFLLAQIDGSVSLDDLFALSGMGRLDTARILAQLLEEKVIGL